MIVVLTGDNDFARRAELRKLTDAFTSEYGDFGLEKIEAGEVEVGRLLESVASLPFLAPRRMIVLEEPSKNKSVNEHIEQLLDAVAETTDLIIVETSFDKRLTLYKTLKKRADFRDFTALDEHGLARWLVTEAKARGGELKPSDASYLVQRLGSNQLGISNEIDKLLSYQPVITRASIDELTEPLARSTIFDLLDAAFAGNTKRAIELYEDQRKQQIEPIEIMRMIAWQVHMIAVVKANEKSSVEDIARKVKIHPYVARKILGLAQGLSLKEVKDLVHRALALDVRLKSEMVDADDAIQHFLMVL